MHLCLTVPRSHLDLMDRGGPIRFAEAALFRDVPEYAESFVDYKGAVLFDNSPFKVGVYSGYGDPNLTFAQILDLLADTPATSSNIRHPIVVLPDVKGDSTATLVQAKDATRILHDRFPLFTAPRTCIVVQGGTFPEWFECLARAHTTLKPDMIGIPYAIEFESPNSLFSWSVREKFKVLRAMGKSRAWTWAMNRAELVLSLEAMALQGASFLDPDIKIHLFGLGHPVELTFYSGDSTTLVYSLDTTLPFVTAAEGICFDEGSILEREKFYGPDVEKPIWSGAHQLTSAAAYTQVTVDLFMRNKAAMYRALVEGSYHSIVERGGVL